MKNLRYIALAVIALITIDKAMAQDIDAKLTEAKSSYKSGNLDDSRFALQQALDAVDQAIGKEILAILPGKMGSMVADDKSDNVTGSSAGFGGIYVNREYNAGEDQPSSSVQLITDSPLLTGINAILAMPAMLAGSDPNQKRIKVDGYKALMQRNEGDNGDVSYDVQIPFGNSLLTFHCDGVSNENDVVAMANTIPVSKIAKMAQ